MNDEWKKLATHKVYFLGGSGDGLHVRRFKMVMGCTGFWAQPVRASGIGAKTFYPVHRVHSIVELEESS
jgi:hypothetical protein